MNEYIFEDLVYNIIHCYFFKVLLTSKISSRFSSDSVFSVLNFAILK